jgi:starch synthase
VASIPQTKVQVYFIDNEEFFSRRGQTVDADGNPYADNGERAIFFARGVIETIKKLRWVPDIIHCQGWMSSFVPMYVKKAYYEEPSVCNAKIVTSMFEEQPKGELENNLKESIAFKDVTLESLQQYPDKIDRMEMAKMAIDYSDGVILTSKKVPQDIVDYTKSVKAQVLNIAGYENVADKYNKFYETLLAK